MKKNIAILGAGSFGTALAKLISDCNNCNVILWSAVDEEIKNIIRDKENKKCLPGINIDTDTKRYYYYDNLVIIFSILTIVLLFIIYYLLFIIII